LINGCTKYLDMKPDQSLAVPSKLKDLQAIMDFELYTIRSYPAGGDIGADYYYMDDKDLAARNVDVRGIYQFADVAYRDIDWTDSYKKIFYANVVLDEIEKVSLDGFSEQDRQSVKGSALFLRGWNFLHVAQLFASAYNFQTAGAEMGIALRLTSDINEPSTRATLEETFRQITEDLKSAAAILPEESITPTRPSKAAAFAALARTFLYMGNYEEAMAYADAALALQNALIDFNLLDSMRANPFDLFNKEVILHNTLVANGSMLSPNLARLDTALYRSYDQHDLRKNILYQKRVDGSYSFKGNYSGDVNSSLLFSGLAVDECYLIKAECAARLNLLEEAANTIRTLAENRYRKGHVPALDFTDAQAALQTVLDERKKELAFRGGVRWADLKRLNLSEHTAKKLTRVVKGELFELEPNSSRYNLLIPVEVIRQSGIPQNPRD
jgi:starch-binding outer membrane protein, SusD/RagB family